MVMMMIMTMFVSMIIVVVVVVVVVVDTVIPISRLEYTTRGLCMVVGGRRALVLSRSQSHQ